MVVEELSERCKNLTTTVQNLEHSSHVLEKVCTCRSSWRSWCVISKTLNLNVGGKQVVKIKDEVIAKLQTSQV